MEGQRIEDAKKALHILIRSIPQGSKFNSMFTFHLSSLFLSYSSLSRVLSLSSYLPIFHLPIFLSSSSYLLISLFPYFLLLSFFPSLPSPSSLLSLLIVVGFGSSFEVMAEESLEYNKSSFAIANALVDKMRASLGINY